MQKDEAPENIDRVFSGALFLSANLWRRAALFQHRQETWLRSVPGQGERKPKIVVKT